MDSLSFVFSRTPRIIFGPGVFDRIGETLAAYGRHILLVTGGKSFRASAHWPALQEQAGRFGLCLATAAVAGEPSPEIVDAIVAQYAGVGVSAVCSIGGGSVIDAGKAIAAMLPVGGSVFDYLEAVGAKPHPGVKTPFVAVPTTAGAGSEATKNAVLSRIGPEGFKRSLRHDNFIPDVAVVDPALTLSCPSNITAACGMDAFTQLLESYVSAGASPMTDALAFTGIERVKSALTPLCAGRLQDMGLRTAMSYAALISGITLANAGLGVVHSFASTIGGMFAIPHGVICGLLLGPCTEANIRALQRTSGGRPTLAKYACIGTLLSGDYSADLQSACRALVNTIADWTARLRLPHLSDYGVTAAHATAIAEKTVVKSNCAALSREELAEIIAACIDKDPNPAQPEPDRS